MVIFNSQMEKINMKYIKHGIVLGLGALLAVGVSSCKNPDKDWPDYEGGVTAYFANQYPVKCITLGEDGEQDNSLDNEHKYMIYATQGGAYKSRDLRIEVVVDNSLTNKLKFSDGSPVKVMPETYYSLESNVLTKKKDFLFGTTVTLSDAFFADPDAIKQTYVIPLRMVNAIGADRILSGTPIEGVENPDRCDPSAWDVKPKDYILYCVRYINPWHSSYLRRGIDQITEDGKTKTEIRHKEYVEYDEVVYLTTKSLNQAVFPVSTVVPDGESVKTLTCNMVLTFNGDECTISSDTPGITASGTGKFVKDGEEKSWDNEDRDALYLDYQINFGIRQFATKDTLVVRAREVKAELNFNPTYNK